MFLTEEKKEALTAKKKEKAGKAFHRIESFIEKKNPGLIKYLDGGYCQTETELTPGCYAAYIKINSSGNEPKIYAHVYDNNDRPLVYYKKLATDPTSYGEVAAAAGAFLETFNEYVFYNNI